MTLKEFNELINPFFDKEFQLRVIKGAEYAPDKQDVLSNFKQVARLIGVTPTQACLIFLMKHIFSICDSAIRDVPDLDSKICDARNYLLFYAALHHETKD